MLGGAEPRRQHVALMRLFEPATGGPCRFDDELAHPESVAGVDEWGGVGWDEVVVRPGVDDG